MAALLAEGELTLSGDVGDAWFGDHFTYSEVVVALAQIEDSADLTVRINSGGGIATEGAAIHALLARRQGRTNVVVEGIAASAASLIAMAGETVTMAQGAIMMIHDPSGMTFGTSDDHAKSIEGLEALATAYARVYAAKSGRSSKECREIMKRETWMTSAEAVERGFADEAGSDSAGAVAAFDYRIYAHAPKRLTALARKNGWSREAAGAPAAKSVATTRQQEENSMTEKERADALAAEIEQMKTAHATALTRAGAEAIAADRARRASVMALEEVKGRESLADTLCATQLSVEEIKAALSAAPKAAANQGDYEQRRLAAAGLAQPGTVEKADHGWGSVVAQTNKRRA
ncbi:head maturation protease, ClpP-related [Mesorhizobium loti]|uniref:head maturation protease, ClpP-related n=1 Tax=Rhizobium loti TaxID=381 RepID=UPI00040B1319|nr:head maturation protease, ClpP-related [Mesorhizobium loti]